MPITPTLAGGSLMPSGALYGNYAQYTAEDWSQQAPQAGCNCSYCKAFYQYHPTSSVQLPVGNNDWATITSPNPENLMTYDEIAGGFVFSDSEKKQVKTKSENSLSTGGIPVKSQPELTRELQKTKVLYLLRGTNGSGKSTLAFLISGAYRKVLGIGVQVVESDDFFVQLGAEGEAVYLFQESKLPEAHAHCQERVRSLMSPANNLEPEGRTRVIIVANTFVSRQHLLPYQRLAREFGYKVIEIICKNDFGNLHGVLPNEVRKNRQNFEN